MHNRQNERKTGLSLGAVDYLSKPFDLEELFLRAQNAIVRTQRESLTDARTGLPGRQLVDAELEAARIQAAAGDAAVCALRLSLRHADAFRNQYGALAWSDVLRFTSLLLTQTLHELGQQNTFLGQSDEQIFVLIAAREPALLLAQTAIARFNADVEQHYALAVRDGDLLRTRDVTGAETVLPAMKLEATEIALT